MKTNFYIQGFKCFNIAEFNLNNITVLCGINGGGKSTVIQALLLCRLAIELNLEETKSHDFIGSNWKECPTPLNAGYKLNLGTVLNIFNEDYNGNKIIFKIDSDEFVITLNEGSKDGNDSENSVKITMESSQTYLNTNLPFWRKREFYYLNAERIGPRYTSEVNYTKFMHAGFQGEFTAQVLLQGIFFRVDEARQYKDAPSQFLPQQTDAWLNYVCPGTGVKVIALNAMNAQIMLHNSFTKNDIPAPNIGFGITYALPIIITGLIAVKGSVFIIENPEAHLHPKGQSNIGYFLGCIAAAGIKVIIETHSEHVVNGIRRALFSYYTNRAEDYSLYFFDADHSKNQITPIILTPTGDLNPFPLDFFDQVQQDMAAIYHLKKQKNG